MEKTETKNELVNCSFVLKASSDGTAEIIVVFQEGNPRFSLWGADQICIASTF